MSPNGTCQIALNATQENKARWDDEKDPYLLSFMESRVFVFIPDIFPEFRTALVQSIDSFL